MTWENIEKLPEEYKNSHRMFVVIGINVHPFDNDYTYTTDPVCVWYDEKEENKFQRWVWNFLPTHFCELPKSK